MESGNGVDNGKLFQYPIDNCRLGYESQGNRAWVYGHQEDFSQDVIW